MQRNGREVKADGCNRGRINKERQAGTELKKKVGRAEKRCNDGEEGADER